ncbi:MAG: tRNA pseudouridine synthase B [Alphaproteobacteria bacterium MarineAlpha4_Bin2]|nr:MAG: tRNA pseudouridine synthase B [Alphaproteobacteria bacterium MarineAlpha4_Bin2]
MARHRKSGQIINGWIILDKPTGMTSASAVGAVRRRLNAQKAGHAGTLDPLATGVLPIALGEATKTLPYVVGREKTYRFTLRWGIATTTDDEEGETTERSGVRPSQVEIEAALPRFVGEIEQVPPIYSAIKVDGERAYNIARRGGTIALEPRRIWIESFRLLEILNTDCAVFTVVSGKGAYMRSLARDLALHLGTVGHIAQLRRDAVSGFSERDAISLDELDEFGHSPAAFKGLLPVEAALDDIPALALTEQEAAQLRNGQAVQLLKKSDLERIGAFGKGEVLLATAMGKPVALAKYSAGEVRPVRVLNM